MGHQQQRQGFAQSAMNAAAGGNAIAAGMNAMTNAAQGTPQLYAQMLRQQQENQQKAAQQAAAVVGNAQSPGNGNGTGGNSAQGHAHRASSGLAMYWYGCGYFGFWLWNGWEGRGKVAWLAGIT